VKIGPLNLREANDFVEQHRRHSARKSGDGGKFVIGHEAGGELFGAAITRRPAARLFLGLPIRFIGLLDFVVWSLGVAPRNSLRNIRALLIGLLFAAVTTFFRGQHRFRSIRHDKIPSMLGVLSINERRPRKTLL
jgi:hypothetical protein